MATVVDVLARAARMCSVPQPSSWIAATSNEHVELRDDFLQETVYDILDRVDLPAPCGAQTTITGDGSETYALPDDFRRMQRDGWAVYETTTTRRAGIPITDDGQWTHLKTIGTAGGDRYYRVTGYDGNWDISFYRNPGAGESITVSYITNNWMANAAGTAGSELTVETDVLLLPREIVQDGIVWRFRQRRGLPYQDARMAYEAKLARLSNDSRGRRKIVFGDTMQTRPPWDVPVPDFIPSS